MTVWLYSLQQDDSDYETFHSFTRVVDIDVGIRLW